MDPRGILEGRPRIRELGDARLEEKAASLSDGEEPEDLSSGRNFHCVKPWTGNVHPPSDWDPATLNPRAPAVSLQLDYVYGYRARQTRCNLHWIDEPNVIMYHAASVCVICNIVDRTQRFFLGHTDDILCLDYNPVKRLAGSGGLGKRSTAPLIIWKVDTLETVQIIRGTLEFAILAAAFSANGNRIFALGGDTDHTVALFDVMSGACLASMRGDSSKIVHAINNTTENTDSLRNWISVGVSHVKFWSKNKSVFTGKKAIGGDINRQTMVSAACTKYFVLCGNVSGGIYVFLDGTLVNTIKAAHEMFVACMFTEKDSFGFPKDNGTIFSGGRDGHVKEWTIDPPDPVDVKKKIKLHPVQTLDMNPHSYMSNPTRKMKLEKHRPKNGPRSLCVRNGQILVGTQLSSIYVLRGQDVPITVLEAHCELDPGSMDELWGMDIHPRDPLFCSVGEDSTLRLWSLDLGSMILMTGVFYPARCCAFTPDGSTICVGHTNGAFSVWDAMTLTPIIPFTRMRSNRVECLSISLDGHYLALGMGQSHVIDVYDARREYQYVGSCDCVSAIPKKMDWNDRSDVVRCCTSGYELIHFSIPSCEVNQGAAVGDEKWKSQNCMIGWGVQGIWEGCNDGTDVNSLDRSHSEKYIAVGYDSSRVRLFNFPCVPRTVNVTGKEVFPEHREFHGHSSHVTEMIWSADDRYVLSVGGMDLTILRWKVVSAGTDVPQTQAESSVREPADAQRPQDAVDEGRIRELSSLLRKKYSPDSPRDAGDGASDSRNASPARAASPVRSASSPPRRAGPRPRSAVLKAIPSRLFQSTASAQVKAQAGRSQRQHVLKTEQANKRFKYF